MTMRTIFASGGASRRNLLRGAAAASVGLAATSAGGANAKTATQIRSPNSATDYISTKDGTRLYFKDWGSGPAVVFSHGYPLSSDAWEDQMLFLAQNGYRVIAHDRR